MTTAYDQLRDAYAARQATNRRPKLAALFRADPDMERLLVIRATQPAVWEQIDTSLRMAAALYSDQKAAAAIEQEYTR